MKQKVALLSVWVVAVWLTGCDRGAGHGSPYAKHPPAYPYVSYAPPAVQPPPQGTAMPSSAPSAPPALDLPAQPGPFGLLAPFKLGQSADEVKATAPGLLVPGGEKQKDIGYQVEVAGGKIQAMRISFEHDPKAELVARWGAPVAEGADVAWLVPDRGMRVVLDVDDWELFVLPYMPLARLMEAEAGKLKGIVGDVLSMDRKAFETRYPDAKLRKLTREVALSVAFPPVEATRKDTELEATFSSAGALVAVELTVGAGAQRAVELVLLPVFGSGRELSLCPPAKKPCSLASGVYQADPVTRYGQSELEVTTWPHDFADLTIRWARSKTRTDWFTTLTPPDRVLEAK